MAPESGAPKPVDKGKGKAVEDGKQEKGVANWKKEDDKKIGMLQPGCPRSWL